MTDFEEVTAEWLWARGGDHPHTGQLLAQVATEESRIAKFNPPEGCFGWLPYPIASFITYLSDAVQEATGPRFLDAGCGPGTKLVIAEALFGLQVAGLEIVPAYVAQARARGLRVGLTDARTWQGYGSADIVYFNRPVAEQEAFEKHVMENMRRGGVLISVNGRTRPSEAGWIIVAEEIGDPRAPVHGVWQKP